ncbi:MAG TPA: methyltransferase domain-containing protein [Woeseiaceae bacterium]|nr:methyltransferase domain-containing protein [Woeseiaceae bacterium]
MHEQHPYIPQQDEVRRRFERAAATFDEADFVHRHTAAGLLERLAPMRIASGRVLDLGAATGTLSRALAKRFRRSHVVSIDLAHAMLRRARKARSRFARIGEVEADATRLPLADRSVDVVVCNQLLPWLADGAALFDEVARVLRRDGLFAFATLGPDSLAELRTAWGEGAHVHRFADMHDTGDALLRAGLCDPVLDVDRLTIDYRDTAGLYRDLAACGARNCLAGRRRTLTGKGRWLAAERELAAQMRDGTLSLDLELVYGHAWGGGTRAREGEFRVDVAAIGRRRGAP